MAARKSNPTAETVDSSTVQAAAATALLHRPDAAAGALIYAGSMAAPQISRLLSLASHELRTPANVVVGYLRMTLGERAGPLTPQQRHMLEQAERSCARMVQLLADMSEIARIDTGQATFERKRVSLDALLDEIVSAFVSAPETEVTATRLGERTSASVTADGGRLRRALLGCATAVGRELGVSGVVGIGVAPADDGRMVTVVVRDRRLEDEPPLKPPPGAALDELKGGLGLELPIARRTIEAEGGFAWSETPREGMPAIYVRLPCTS
jgi:signal transduction histidine kinase